MRNLKETIASGTLSREEKANLGLSLIRLTETNDKIPTSVDAYLIDDTDSICFLSADSDDITLASPEFFTGEPADDKDRMLFTVGLLMYSIFFGEDYYEAHNLTPFDFSSLAENGSDSLIDAPDCNAAIRAFTAWNPLERINGISRFFEFLLKDFDNRIRVEFICGDTTVKVIEEVIKGDLKSYPREDFLTVDDQRRYMIPDKIDIPFRVGTNNYRIKVIMADEPTHDPEPRPVEQPVPSQQLASDEEKVSAICLSTDLPDGMQSLTGIELVCDGNVVLKRTFKNSSLTIRNFPFCNWLRGDDGYAYAVLDKADIEHRPGYYVYRLRAKRMQGDINATVMLHNKSDNSFIRLVRINEFDKKTLSCEVGPEGFELPVFVGYVAEVEQRILYIAASNLRLPPIATNRKVNVTFKTTRENDYYTIDAVIAETGEPILETMKVQVLRELRL